MIRELTINDLKFILVEMEGLQEEHPKAKVIYDIERMRMYVTYPLPNDLKNLKPIKSIELL